MTNIGEGLVDNHYTKISFTNEAELFKDNSLDAEISKLPLYNKEGQEQIVWNLYSRTAYDWRLKCELNAQVDRYDLIAALVNFKNSDKDLSGIQVISTIQLCMTIIALGFLVVLFVKFRYEMFRYKVFVLSV